MSYFIQGPTDLADAVNENQKATRNIPTWKNRQIPNPSQAPIGTFA